MKVTMLLADSAQAVGGKLYILGGGWSITGPQPTPMAIALKIEVPWDQTNMKHQLELQLVDQDGNPVQVPTPTGDRPMKIEAEFEVGRPPGLQPGTPLDVPFAINLGPMPLEPASRYAWHLFIDGETREGWSVGFTTRPKT